MCIQQLLARRSWDGMILVVIVAGFLFATRNGSGWSGAVASAQEAAPAARAPQASPLPPEINLVMKVPGAFTFAGVGDIILRHPVSQLADPNFTGLIRHLREADIAFAN